MKKLYISLITGALISSFILGWLIDSLSAPPSTHDNFKVEKQILAGADPAVPYSSRDDSRRASLVEPTVDQLLQVKGKSTNMDKE